MKTTKKTRTESTLQFMQALTWFTLIGLLAKTAILFFGFLINSHINPESLKDIYNDLDLSEIFSSSRGAYYILTTLILISYAFKILLIFQVTQIFSKINFNQPFKPFLSTLISKMSYVALTIGLLNAVIDKSGLMLLGKEQSTELTIFIESPKVLMFIAGLLFIIAQVLKRGVEIQAENDLTI